MVNSMRSQLAEEMKRCAEEFEGLAAEHFMLTVYKNLENLRIEQIKENATPSEVRNTIKEMRMAAADIMAYHAALDRNKRERSPGPDPMKELLVLDADLGTDEADGTYGS